MRTVEMVIWARLLEKHPELWEKLFPHVPKVEIETLKGKARTTKVDIGNALKGMAPEARKEAVERAKEIANYCEEIVAAAAKISK